MDGLRFLLFIRLKAGPMGPTVIYPCVNFVCHASTCELQSNLPTGGYIGNPSGDYYREYREDTRNSDLTP